jgi:hypothetical protein
MKYLDWPKLDELRATIFAGVMAIPVWWLFWAAPDPSLAAKFCRQYTAHTPCLRIDLDSIQQTGVSNFKLGWMIANNWWRD